MKTEQQLWRWFWAGLFAGWLIGLIAGGSTARASLLAATSIDGAPIVTQPGGTFQLNITSQTPPTTGLAYVMLANKPGIFTLMGRDVTGSPFTVLDVPDGDSAAGLGVLGASALLDPANGSDLGADTVGDSTVTGTQHVATLTFRVATDSPPGVYTIQPWDNLIDGGWYGPGPAFERSVFDDFTNQIVTVGVPEPSALLALTPLLLMRRKRRLVEPKHLLALGQASVRRVVNRDNLGFGVKRSPIPTVVLLHRYYQVIVHVFKKLFKFSNRHGLASYHAGGIC